MDELIYDRTAADDVHAGYLASIEWENMTDAQRDEWLNTVLKGFYEETDMNRVESAVKYLSDLLYSYGYSTGITTKPDWAEGDIPTPADLDRYIANIKKLRTVLAMPPATPNPPDSMDNITWQGANNIERILVELEALINRMAAAVRHSGTFNSGMEGLRV